MHFGGVKVLFCFVNHQVCGSFGGKAMQPFHMGGNPPCLLQVRACFILIKLCLLFGMMSSGGSSMGHVGQCPPKENVEMTFLHSN